MLPTDTTPHLNRGELPKLLASVQEQEDKVAAIKEWAVRFNLVDGKMIGKKKKKRSRTVA